jgi:hypothetical protein
LQEKARKKSFPQWTTDAGQSTPQVTAGKELLNGGIHDLAKGTVGGFIAGLVGSLEVVVTSREETEKR